ncbi:MAG: LysO family transporter [Clostridiales bacterium]|nr:LysO family transporter [Clostridiales bacterium]
MLSLILYLVMLVAGAFVGSKVLSEDKEYKWIGIIQFIAIIILVLAIGIRIGSDERVISSLGDIGISSLIVTVFAIVGSICGVYLVRKLMNLDREGLPKDD